MIQKMTNTKHAPNGERITNSSSFARYLGEELRPQPGITDDRMEAFALPSLMGKWRVWPDGRRELANGASE